MKAFRLLAISLVAALCVGLNSCGNKSQGSNSIVGTWKEYRADTNDDYGLSSWKVSFTWESTNNSTITINLNGEETTLELNNGLLIENSALGSVVFKKQ